MTDLDRNLLNNNLKNFDSFLDFHKFLFSRGIELTYDEWAEYREKFFKILELRKKISKDTALVNVDLSGLILP